MVRRLPARDPIRDQLRPILEPQAQVEALAEAGLLRRSDIQPADFGILQAALLGIVRRHGQTAQGIHQALRWTIIEPDYEAIPRFTEALIELLWQRIVQQSSANDVPAQSIQMLMRDLAGTANGYETAASGFSELGAIAATIAGPARVAYEWVHGWFGAPANPDPEHEHNNGTLVAFPRIVEGRYIGDHSGCTCHWVPNLHYF